MKSFVLNTNSGANLPIPFIVFYGKAQTNIRVFRPVTADLWFLCNSVFMQLICLLPYFFAYSVLMNPCSASKVHIAESLTMRFL